MNEDPTPRLKRNPAGGVSVTSRLSMRAAILGVPEVWNLNGPAANSATGAFRRGGSRSALDMELFRDRTPRYVAPCYCWEGNARSGMTLCPPLKTVDTERSSQAVANPNHDQVPRRFSSRVQRSGACALADHLNVLPNSHLSG